MVRTSDSGTVTVFKKRRNIELLLVVFACLISSGGYLSAAYNIYGTLPKFGYLICAGWVFLGVGLHLVVRRKWPYADPIILPIAMLLNGLGLAMIWRIDQISNPIATGSTKQLVWTVLAMIFFLVVAFWMKDYRALQRYPYLLFALGLILMLLPLVPGIGVRMYGAQIWIRIAGLSFQPAEISKILLVFAFAAYLAEKREVLAEAGTKIFGINFPRPRDLGPILIMWSVSIVVLVFQNDFGTSLLFFAMFVMMLYVATEKPGWPILGGLLFAGAAVGVYTIAGHVRIRVSAWLDPFSNYDQNYQIIQAQYGMAWGGLTGRGWGLGRPGLTPLARSDMIAAAVGEELGLLALAGLIMLYGFLVVRGLKAALVSTSPYGKLLACGFSFVVALQVFSIIGGVTRLLPLTGLTTPFISQGGSSLLSNWIIVAILLAVSHDARRPLDQPLTTEVVDLVDEETAVIS